MSRWLKGWVLILALLGLAGVVVILATGCTRAERDPFAAFRTDDKIFSFWITPF